MGILFLLTDLCLTFNDLSAKLETVKTIHIQQLKLQQKIRKIGSYFSENIC